MGMKMIQHIRNFPNYKKKLWTAFCKTIFMAPFFSYWIVFVLLLIKRGYLLKEEDLQYISLGFFVHYAFSFLILIILENIIYI